MGTKEKLPNGGESEQQNLNNIVNKVIKFGCSPSNCLEFKQRVPVCQWFSI